MPTNVPTGNMNFPYSLGKISPGASFASLCVPLTTNFQPTKRDGQKGTDIADNEFNGIFIQANPSNTVGSYMFICNSASAPDTTNYTNIIAFLPPGAVFTRSKEWSNNRDISKIFIGALNSTDFVIANIDQF